MKKSILIFCAVISAVSLTAFGYMNWRNDVTDQARASCCKSGVSDEDLVNTLNYDTDPNFLYDVGTRFSAIKKTELDKARSIIDFLPVDMTQQVMHYKSVSVIIIEDDRQSDIRETGISEVLTDAQLKLLRSANYSTNFLIRADYQEKNNETGDLTDSYFTPHLTIVPETQAVYKNGKDALIQYFKENSKEKTSNVEEKKLKPAKLYFTVSKKGTISNLKLGSTSGYTDIDKMMIELTKTIPGGWEPATNSKGEKVDQELVFSFGLMGC